MECKQCMAYGIDNLGFFGCLVKHEMMDFLNKKVGCRMKQSTIEKKILNVKITEPRSKDYKWIHEKENTK